jgi:hypothetical protein
MTADPWEVYQRRINQNGSTQKDRFITNTQRTIIDKFSNTSELVTINGTSQEVQIIDENSLFKNPNKKRLLCKPDETISVGDLVVYDSENWLCTDTDDIEIYIRGIIEKCNSNLKYLDSTETATSTWDEDDILDETTIFDESYTYNEGADATILLSDLLGVAESASIIVAPCIITDKILLDAKENKYYILPDNKIWVIVGTGTDTTSITVGQRFLLGGNAYKIEAIDNITKPGLITFKMCFDNVIEDDSQTLGIANYTSRLHSYVVTILNGADADIQVGNTLQLELECTDNDVVVTSPTVTYSLVTGSTGYISVGITGLVSGIATGSGSVVATYSNATDSININVVASAVTASYVYSLVGNIQPDNEVKYNQTKTYTANKYYSTGTVVTGSVFTFSTILSTGASSSNYLLTTSSDNTTTLKCLQYPYSISLVATDLADATQNITQVISLKGLI